MQPEDSPRPIDLAGTPPFRLGGVLVEPAALELCEPGGARVRLQPRAMQVLVALRRGAGGTLSRDELNRDCWNGRVVGTDALDRTITHLRRASAELGGSFRIETIPRVGFRLLAEEAATEAVDHSATGAVDHSATEAVDHSATEAVDTPATDEAGALADALAPVAHGRPAALGRRAAILGAGVLAVGGAAALARWDARTGPPPDETEARRLVALGQAASREEHDRQAVSYFERAAALDPRLAAAWGGLALAHQNVTRQDNDAIETGRVRAAAGRALAIDPGNADATAALILIPPMFRNWGPLERAIRLGLQRQPANSELLLAICKIDIQTGRWRDAVDLLRRDLGREPLRVGWRKYLAVCLWGADDLAGADQAFADASQLWPENRSLWLWRLHFLALTGRPREAQAMALNEGARPPQAAGDRGIAYATYATCAEALLPDRTPERERAVATLTAAYGRGDVATFEAVLYLSALGRIDAVFAILGEYYFENGPREHWQPGPLAERYTGFLFLPPLAAVRRDSRFTELTERIGLADCWRETASWPDDRAAIATARP